MNESVLEMLATPGEVEKRARVFVEASGRMKAEREKITKARNLEKALKEAVADRAAAKSELDAARIEASGLMDRTHEAADGINAVLEVRERKCRAREDALTLRERAADKAMQDAKDLQAGLNQRAEKLAEGETALAARLEKLANV